MDRLLRTDHLHIDAQLAAREHAGRHFQLVGGGKQTVQRLMAFESQRFRLVLGEILLRRARRDVVGDDLDHVHVGNEFVKQSLQRDQRTADRGDGARHFDAVALRHLRQGRQHGGDVQFGQVHCAEFLDDHVQIGQQCRIILRIGLSSGETQQTVGKLGGILLGHGEDHVLQHGTGFGVEPASHAQVEQHDLPTAHHDVAGVRVRVEEAFVEYLRGVVVHEFGADFLQVVAGCKQLVRMGDGDAFHVVHDHHVFGA